MLYPSHFIGTIDISENVQEEKQTKISSWKKFVLGLNMIFIVADHLTDILLIVTLFQLEQFWYASIYLAVDVFPAAIIMWNKYQTEKSWKVLVKS